VLTTLIWLVCVCSNNIFKRRDIWCEPEVICFGATDFQTSKEVERYYISKVCWNLWKCRFHHLSKIIFSVKLAILSLAFVIALQIILVGQHNNADLCQLITFEVVSYSGWTGFRITANTVFRTFKWCLGLVYTGDSWGPSTAPYKLALYYYYY